MMIPVPSSGVLEGVDGVEQAAATPGVDEIEITARLHDFIAAWPEGSSYLGFIFARAERLRSGRRAAPGACGVAVHDHATPAGGASGVGTDAAVRPMR